MWPLISSSRIVLGVRGGLLGRVGELDAAGLHPAAAQHLRLDHDRPADLLGGLAGLLGGRAEAVLGDGDPRQLDDLPCLELVEAHQRRGTLSDEPTGGSPPDALGYSAGDPCQATSDELSARCWPQSLALARRRLRCVGCGETVIDDAKTEETLQARPLEGRVHEQDHVASIARPTRRSKPGTTFTCTRDASPNGKKQTATLKILNEDADVERRSASAIQ